MQYVHQRSAIPWYQLVRSCYSFIISMLCRHLEHCLCRNSLSCEFTGLRPGDKGDGDGRPARVFDALVKEVDRTAIQTMKLNDHVAGRVSSTPYDVLQALDIVLRFSQSNRLIPIGRNRLSVPFLGSQLEEALS